MAILAEIGQDARFGARTLLRNPGFAATVVLTLALATGATAAIFSVVNSVLLRPLPFGDPDRLVQVYGRNWGNDRAGLPDPMTAPVGSMELEAFGKQSTTVEAFAGFALTTRHLEGPSGVERLTAVWADGGVLLDARRRGARRPDVPGRRSAGSGRDQRQPVAAPLRRRSLAARQVDRARRPAVHGPRRHAGRVSVSVPARHRGWRAR